jgi:hypothetical protein
VRPQGQGWIYYNASGHNHLTWRRLEFRSQLLRALNWGYQMKVTGIRGKAALDMLTRAHGNELFVPLREKYSLEIMDMQGRRVFFRGRSSAASHDLSSLPAGTYGVNILSETREAFKSLYNCRCLAIQSGRKRPWGRRYPLERSRGTDGTRLRLDGGRRVIGNPAGRGFRLCRDNRQFHYSRQRGAKHRHAS